MWDRFRPNLLIVMGLAYVSIVGLFVFLVCVGVDAETAFGFINVPFVALIGGTLAIAKDLLQ